MEFVLDTSAVLTLIEDEAGAGRVEAVLRDEPVWLPWLVLLETYYISLQEQGPAVAHRRYALLKEMPVTFIWEVDEPTVLTAGRLKANYRISLADAVIAAVAIRRGAVLLHKDPEYSRLASELPLEALPYKSKVD